LSPVKQVLLLNRIFITFVQTADWSMMTTSDREDLCMTMSGLNTYCPVVISSPEKIEA